MPTLPLEEQVLAAIASRLDSTISAGSDYFYTCERAVRPVQANVKHLDAVPVDNMVALVEADSAVYVQDSPGLNCGTEVQGQVIVTGAVPYRHTAAVAESGYDLPTMQQKIVHDLRKALHNVEIVVGVRLTVTDRLFAVEVGGWAVAQVSVGWNGSEVL